MVDVSAGLQVGLDDLAGVFQPVGLEDSVDFN